MTEDAWLAVGQNMTHMHEIKPLMPHVYTEAEEKFGLFYTISKPLDIHKSGSLAKIQAGLLDGHENW